MVHYLSGCRFLDGTWLTVVIAAVLAALFDLSRIASLGAIFYLMMDIAIHWGVSCDTSTRPALCRLPSSLRSSVSTCADFGPASE